MARERRYSLSARTWMVVEAGAWRKVGQTQLAVNAYAFINAV
jgi:hypothetical protein